MSLNMWQGAEQEFAAGSWPMGLFEALGKRGVYVFKPDDGIPRAFLRNGGLCYIHGNLFEVCTPECRNPLEMLAYEKACEAYARLASWTYQEDTGEQVHLYKTNIATDPKGEVPYTTVGSHENYLVKREKYVENIHLLIPYLVLRQVFCGAGGYVNGRYLVSPRTIFPKTLYSETSTDYPIISTRDESHTDDVFSRAHIVNGEGARSEVTTFLKHSITSYILRAIEQGHLTSVPEIEAPIESNKAISLSLDGDWTVPLKEGAEIRVIDYLNSHYLEAIERVFADGSPADHDLMALREFKWVLGKLDEGLIESLDTSIEWVIKMRLTEKVLDEYIVEEGLSMDAAKEAAMYQYTAVTDPLYDELVESHGLRTIISEENVKKAFMDPPCESRGTLRVALAKRFKDELKTMSWSYIKLKPEINYYPFEFNELGGWTNKKIKAKTAEIQSLIDSSR
ncbi:MAG: proteasome accessory factor PafA2 family protein [Candidatus Bathyarchaeota archaeon]|nr:proteasome accessory factor PafA2 family protein [Candidatus Bathyarchaeota archaeon]